MKLKTKTILLYTLVGSTLVATGAGLGVIFGVGNAHKVNIKMINNNPGQYKTEHIGILAGSILCAVAGVLFVITIEFLLSYLLTVKFVKLRKEKLKQAAKSNPTYKYKTNANGADNTNAAGEFETLKIINPDETGTEISTPTTKL